MWDTSESLWGGKRKRHGLHEQSGAQLEWETPAPRDPEYFPFRPDHLLPTPPFSPLTQIRRILLRGSEHCALLIQSGHLVQPLSCSCEPVSQSFLPRPARSAFLTLFLVMCLSRSHRISMGLRHVHTFPPLSSASSARIAVNAD